MEIDNTCGRTGLIQAMSTINLNQVDISELLSDILTHLASKSVSHKIISDAIEETICDRKSNGKDSTILEIIWTDLRFLFTGKNYILQLYEINHLFPFSLYNVFVCF